MSGPQPSLPGDKPPVNAFELKRELVQFTSSEMFYRHRMTGHVYSEGVKHLAEQTGANWLLDKIFTLQSLPAVRREAFQSWELTVENTVGRLVCEDGMEKIVYEEDISFTDFPLDSIVVWFEGATLYLPSEH